MDSDSETSVPPNKRKPLIDIGNTVGHATKKHRPTTTFERKNSSKRKYEPQNCTSTKNTSKEEIIETPASNEETAPQGGGIQLPSSSKTLNNNNFLALNPELCDQKKWMLEKEKINNHYRPSSIYLSWHPQLTSRMRAILLDWLFEVAEEYSLYRHTAHLAVNFVDRFLSKVPNIPKGTLQLVGIASLFLASKIEEVQPISSKELAMLSDDTYTIEQIHDMESLMAQELGWRLQPVTAYTWAKFLVEIFCKEKDIPFPKKDFFRLMQRIDYLTLHYECLRWSPSIIAASVFCTYFEDDNIMQSVTGHSLNSLTECQQFLTKFSNLSLGKIYDIPEEHLPSNFHEKQCRNPEVIDYIKQLLENDNFQHSLKCPEENLDR